MLSADDLTRRDGTRDEQASFTGIDKSIWPFFFITIQSTKEPVNQQEQQQQEDSSILFFCPCSIILANSPLLRRGTDQGLRGCIAIFHNWLRCHRQWAINSIMRSSAMCSIKDIDEQSIIYAINIIISVQEQINLYESHTLGPKVTGRDTFQAIEFP